MVSFDVDGVLGVTLVSHEDPEEYETRIITEFSGLKILGIHFNGEKSTLFVVSRSGKACLFLVDIDQFNITLLN